MTEDKITGLTVRMPPKKWTKEEETELLLKGKVEGRTEGAMAIRKRIIALRRIEAGETVKKVISECGITEEELVEARKIEDKKKDKKMVKSDKEALLKIKELVDKLVEGGSAR